MKHGHQMTLYLRSDYHVQFFENLVLSTDSNYIVSFTDSLGAPGGEITGPREVGAQARTFAFTNTRNKADVTVSKMVSGIMASKDQDFNFSLFVTTDQFGFIPVNGTISYTGGVVAGTNAVAPASGTATLVGGTHTFTLKHGQTLTFDLQGDWAFRFIETIDTRYTPAFTDTAGGPGVNNTGLRPVGTVARTVAFTNTHNMSVPTGIEDSNISAWVFTATAGLAVVSSLLFTAARGRRKRGTRYGNA